MIVGQSATTDVVGRLELRSGIDDSSSPKFSPAGAAYQNILGGDIKVTDRRHRGPKFHDGNLVRHHDGGTKNQRP